MHSTFRDSTTCTRQLNVQASSTDAQAAVKAFCQASMTYTYYFPYISIRSSAVTVRNHTLVIRHVRLFTSWLLRETKDQLGLNLVGRWKIIPFLQRHLRQVAVVLQTSAVALSLKQRPYVDLCHTRSVVRPNREIRRIRRVYLLLHMDELLVLKKRGPFRSQRQNP